MPHLVSEYVDGLRSASALAPLRLDISINNDWHGHAITDARWLRKRLAAPGSARKTA